MPDDLAFILIPLLIFFGRIIDVSLGTVRMITVISGHRYVSALLGFVEVLVWVLAAGSAVGRLDEPLAVLGFAGGFAVGTLVGMTIEQRMAIGYRIVRVINPDATCDLSASLREQGYRATRLSGEEQDGPVEIVFVPVKRKKVPAVLEHVSSTCPDSFASVERAERISEAFSPTFTSDRFRRFGWFPQLRK